MTTSAGPACPYCASTVSAPGPDGVMTQCRACGALYVFPPPTREALTAYYTHGTVEGMRAQLREQRAGTSQRSAYAAVARRILAAWKQHGDGSQLPASIADVGAGALELTDALLHATTDTTVTSFDISFGERSQPSSGRSRLQSIDLNHLDTADDGARFDVVACVAVLEHVIDPCALMHFLARITSSRGFVYALVPDCESPASRLTGRKWPYYCPDEHLSIPTKRALQRLVERCGGHGELIVRTIRMPYSLQYVLRYLGLRMRLPRMLDLVVPVPSGVLEMIWKPGR